VVDEPHALQRIPSRAVSSNESYDEGIGQIKLSASASAPFEVFGESFSLKSGTEYKAFDGLTSTSWDSTPTRNTRVSEEVDFGTWLKIQTPESVSLKKAEIESNPYWNQVGAQIVGTATNQRIGRAVACSHDGTRIIAGSYDDSTSQGKVIVYDWNGTIWTQVGNVLTGVADYDQFGHKLAISGDGNIIAVTAPYEHGNSLSDSGTVRVYYLVGATWTILPDSGSFTESESGIVDVFVGATTLDYLGYGGVKLSYDGYTISMGSKGHDITGKSNVGRARVFTYSSGAWSQKGTEK
jgi:hypothetical protein